MRAVAGGSPFKVTFPARVDLRASVHDGRMARLRERRRVRRRTRSQIERALVADAVAAGARYVQFDFPLYPYLVDPRGSRGSRPPATTWTRWSTPRSRPMPPCSRASPTRSRSGSTSAAGTTARRGCARARSSQSPSASSAGPPTTRSWWSGTTRVATAGPRRCATCVTGAVMVMGLISSKTPALEDEDDLVRRMEQRRPAGGMDRLAISPQCGFASVMVGNETTRTRSGASSSSSAGSPTDSGVSALANPFPRPRSSRRTLHLTDLDLAGGARCRTTSTSRSRGPSPKAKARMPQALPPKAGWQEVVGSWRRASSHSSRSRRPGADFRRRSGTAMKRSSTRRPRRSVFARTSS